MSIVSVTAEKNFIKGGFDVYTTVPSTTRAGYRRS